MAIVEIVVSRRDLAKVQRLTEGIRNGVPRVLTRSINKVARSKRTEAVRYIAKRTRFLQEDVKKLVRLKTANFRNLSARVIVRGKGIPLIKLKAKGRNPSLGKGKGVTYINPLTGQRELLPHSFIATMPKTGHKGVFLRATFGGKVGSLLRNLMRRVRGRSVQNGRLPIHEQYAGSVVDVFKPMVKPFTRDAQEKLRKEIEVQTRLIVEKANAVAG